MLAKNSDVLLKTEVRREGMYHCRARCPDSAGEAYSGRPAVAVVCLSSTAYLSSISAKHAPKSTLSALCKAAARPLRCALPQAEVSRLEDKTYSSLSEVPGTMVERHAVEDERFTASALYNLACSSTGVTSILDTADNAVLGEPLL